MSDSRGLLWRNESYGNVIGMILCNFDPKPGPGGTTIKAEVSATSWTVLLNNAHDNALFGYLVLDGANNNLLADNAASNNAVFDMRLLGERERPGLPPGPATFENHVVAGRHQDITIQDCGVNNRIDGGNQIPCN